MATFGLIGFSLLGALSPQNVQAFTTKTLSYGSQGYDVDELQNRLRFIGFYWGPINGQFDWKTYLSVRTFQYDFHIPVTGIADENTKIHLANATKDWKPTNVKSSNLSTVGNTSQAATGSASANSTSSTPSLPAISHGVSARNMNLMAHAVYGEARGEPFVGQVAVAAVILNRMHDPRFPHSIPGILYQPGAFDCVNNGQFNLTPNATAYKAVQDAVNGWDPSHGAVYYFNPATSTSAWIWSQPEITQIGHHIFSS